MLKLLVVLFIIGCIGVAKLLCECFVLVNQFRRENVERQHKYKWKKIFRDIYGD
jgi:uncharacterized membrane protein YciS (DUF1049 family)